MLNMSRLSVLFAAAQTEAASAAEDTAGISWQEIFTSPVFSAAVTLIVMAVLHIAGLEGMGCANAE